MLGDSWFDFLGRTKAVLGVESGSSILCVDDQLERLSEIARRNLGPETDDAAYAEAFLRYLEPIDWKTPYTAISPRHFEAAAMRSLQIMFPGEYSNLFVGGRHFFPLERDYTNIEEAVELLRDSSQRQRYVDAAYEEIILDRRNWLEGFIESIDLEIEEALERKDRQRGRTMIAPKSNRKHVALLCAHAPDLDPRIKWIADGVPKDLQILTIGVVSDTVETSLGQKKHANPRYCRRPGRPRWPSSRA